MTRVLSAVLRDPERGGKVGRGREAQGPERRVHLLTDDASCRAAEANTAL